MNSNAAEKDSTIARNYKLHNQTSLSSTQSRLESLPRIENHEYKAASSLFPHWVASPKTNQKHWQSNPCAHDILRDVLQVLFQPLCICSICISLSSAANSCLTPFPSVPSFLLSNSCVFFRMLLCISVQAYPTPPTPKYT